MFGRVVMRCAIWYHLYNLKKTWKTPMEDGVLRTWWSDTYRCNHSHKKQKDGLKGSRVGRVLFTTELEFSKILVPRLPQNSSNVKTEPAGKSKQLYSLCHQLLGTLIYRHFIILILVRFWWIMPGVNYAIYGCSSSRTTPGVITIQDLHTGGKTLLQLFLKIGW